ncbi:hypothetical protein PU629_07800 [Pullulanibacillus sp. KACC 23026]|uniref:hypothetical protein n=1 Tax=Pullulanibacillus sp. KACC 23026 TaxID=3028315 RepID=UPI0023B19411|nr:hypothetical protein [Pullulanibacillus sp. KACC 23026]WEG14256.1 hypothetical protein PU629_07800 [Pullulanibacillus sp. KACC 23026]
MKKWLLIIVLAVIGWTSFSDLTHGTLPLIKPMTSPLSDASSSQTTQTTPAPSSSTVTTKTVEPGDTVLSIEEQLNGEKTLSITQVLKDFKDLNPSVDPNHIQIGKAYKFKLYK